MSLYNQSPAPQNLSLRLTPVWEAEGQTAYAGTPAFIIGAAASLGQVGTFIATHSINRPSAHTTPFPPAVQLARLAGHSPIIATASPHNAALIKSLGATHVLDRARSNESILVELPALLGGKPLEYTFVAVASADALRLGRDALAPGGALATISPQPQMLPEDVVSVGDGKRLSFVFGSARLPYTIETGVAMFRALSGWLEKGLLKVWFLPRAAFGVPMKLT